MKLAAIDIGTHSVLLVIIEKKSDGTLQVLEDHATLTRIGEGMGSHQVFLAGGMERTLTLLKRYKNTCDQHQVEKMIAVGTAAFRKAQNAKQFVADVKKECGIAIDIIPGEREAELTWKAASTDFGEEIAVLDIGGGSTEVIAQKENGNLFCTSMPIGSVYLTEKFVHSDPISEEEYKKICNVIDEHLNSLNIDTKAHRHIDTFVATAGTATTLAAIKAKMKIYHHHEVHGSTLSLDEVTQVIKELKSKTIAERKKISGLEPGRADVILAGATLMQKVAQHFGIQTITVSDRGVRWGLIYEALSQI